MPRPSAAVLTTCLLALVLAAGTAPGGAAAPVAAPSSRNPTVTGPGPAVNRDHWHAAYGIYVCDRYLPNLDGSAFADPDGIHTHDDGLIHIHPFTARAAGPDATLGRFLAAIDMTVQPGRSLRVEPLRLALRQGDACPGSSANRGPIDVRVLLWPTRSSPRPVLVPDPSTLPLRQDQVIAFVAAPVGVIPPQPRSVGELEEPGDVALALPLTAAQRAARGSQPTIRFPTDSPPRVLQVTTIRPGNGQPVKAGDLVAVDVVVGTWLSRSVVDSTWSSEPIVFRVGKGRMLEGLEQAVVGMREGQVVQVVVPPSLAFGVQDPGGGIGPNATLVVVMRLAARQAGPAREA